MITALIVLYLLIASGFYEELKKDSGGDSKALKAFLSVFWIICLLDIFTSWLYKSFKNIP